MAIYFRIIASRGLSSASSPFEAENSRLDFICHLMMKNLELIKRRRLVELISDLIHTARRLDLRSFSGEKRKAFPSGESRACVTENPVNLIKVDVWAVVGARMAGRARIHRISLLRVIIGEPRFREGRK